MMYGMKRILKNLDEKIDGNIWRVFVCDACNWGGSCYQ